MKSIKKKIIVITGGVSTLLGSIGTAIAAFGLCACVLAPLLSLVGILAIVMAFLSDNRILFLIIGILLLIISLIFYKKKNKCKRHRKL